MPDLPAHDLNHFRHAIRRTFLDPFRDWRRSAVFFGIFAGYFGFTLVTVASAYGLGGDGLKELLLYFGPSLLLPAFILWPLLYLGFRTTDGKIWRGFILAAQMMAFVAFLILPKDPLTQGITGGFLVAPFWVVYHISMVQNTTDQNRAFEISLAMFLGICGNVCGTILGGFFPEQGSSHMSIYIAFAALVAATAAVLTASKQRPNVKVSTFVAEARAIVSDNPYLSRRIIGHSVYDMPGFTLAAMMHLLKFSAKTTALILASRVIAEFLLAPAVGHFVHTRRNKGFGLGMILVCVAWLFLFVSPQNTLSLIAFLLINAIGMRLSFNSMIAGLYEMQSYASMMWTEVFLGVGRLLAIAFLLPVLYINPDLYMLELAALAVAIFVLNRHWMRKWNIV